MNRNTLISESQGKTTHLNCYYIFVVFNILLNMPGACTRIKGQVAEKAGRDGTTKGHPSSSFILTRRATFKKDRTGRQSVVCPRLWFPIVGQPWKMTGRTTFCRPSSSSIPTCREILENDRTGRHFVIRPRLGSGRTDCPVANTAIEFPSWYLSTLSLLWG